MDNEPVVNEKIWDAWVKRGRADDKVRERNARLAVVAAAIIGICVGVYQYSPK
jgi:hypothetical protein